MDQGMHLLRVVPWCRLLQAVLLLSNGENPRLEAHFHCLLSQDHAQLVQG